MLFAIICILVQLIETVNSECQKKCEFKEEYCDSYTGQCEPCESICSPPNNPKFNECGQNCVPYLQVRIIYSAIIGPDRVCTSHTKEIHYILPPMDLNIYGTWRRAMNTNDENL